MAYFPFFIDIKHKKCCIIGGGAVACRKVQSLLEFEADITVIAPFLCDEIRQLKDKIHIIDRAYREKDIEDAFCVIAATDQPEVNSAVSEICMERGILVNAVDEIDKCSFLFPAYVKSRDITVGVTTSGKSPAVSGKIRETIEENLPDYYGSFVEALGRYREAVKDRISSSEMRSAIFKELVRLGTEQEGKLTQEDVEGVINKLGGENQNGQDD